VACLLVHVMLQSPPGRQKVDGLGDHAGAADSGDGKRGGEEPDVVQRSCDSQHVDSPTPT
jgi:hypothetical protein